MMWIFVLSCSSCPDISRWWFLSEIQTTATRMWMPAAPHRRRLEGWSSWSKRPGGPSRWVQLIAAAAAHRELRIILTSHCRKLQNTSSSQVDLSYLWVKIEWWFPAGEKCWLLTLELPDYKSMLTVIVWFMMCSRQQSLKQRQDLRRRTTQSEPQRLYLKPRRQSTACSERKSPGRKHCVISLQNKRAVIEVWQMRYERLCDVCDSREKQKMLKEHSVISSLPAASDSVLDASGKSTSELKLTEAEQRLNKHRWEQSQHSSR